MIRFRIDPSKVLGTVSENLYGQMVEHAYWSVHLGLSSQLVDNGGFELDRDGIHHDVAEGWKLLSSNAMNCYHALLDTEKPYNGKHSQKIVIDSYVRGEVVLQQNFIRLRKDVANKGFIFMRGDIGTVKIQLRGIDKRVLAEQTFEVTQADWQRYELNLTPGMDCRDGIFAIIMEKEGSLWVDQAQLYPEDDRKENHTRRDVVELYKGLKPRFLRWPGGTYLIWHHWKNAIGPLEDRVYADGRILKDTFGIGHYGEWDPNLFGTDEFIQLCRDCGAEPMININLKDTLENALDWVEYCNGSADTVWGAKRAANGHAEPYNVKYWVIDNEPMIGGEKKGYAPVLYPLLAAEFARAMKKKEPAIETFIMGNHNTQELMDIHPEYSELVARLSGDVIDKLCVHCYYDQSYYAPMQGMTAKLGDTMDRLKSVLDENCQGRDVKVFLSEFNPEANTNVAGNMGQAIETASIFNMLERKSAQGVVDMATMCQLCVNVDRYRGRWLRSAMVQINNYMSWVSPMYYVTQMYSQMYRPMLVDVCSEGLAGTQSKAFDDLACPDIDMVATRSESGECVVVKAVNNTLDRALAAHISLSGKKIAKIVAHQVSADTIYECNTQYEPDKVTPQVFEVEPKEDGFDFTFAAAAVVAFEVTLCE